MQNFRIAQNFQTYTLRAQRAVQAITATFRYNLNLTVFVNPGSYIQQVLFVVREEGSFYATDGLMVYEVLMWLPSLNVVRTEVDEQYVSVRMNYQSVNIIDIFMKSVVTKWTPLFRLIGTDALKACPIPYKWYNMATSMCNHLIVEDVFAPLTQR